MKQRVHNVKIFIPIELKAKILHAGGKDLSDSISFILERGLVNLGSYNRACGFSKPAKDHSHASV